MLSRLPGRTDSAPRIRTAQRGYFFDFFLAVFFLPAFFAFLAVFFLAIGIVRHLLTA